MDLSIATEAIYNCLYHKFPQIDFHKNFKERSHYLFKSFGFYSKNKKVGGLESNFISLRIGNLCGWMLTYEGLNPSEFVDAIGHSIHDLDDAWDDFGGKLWGELIKQFQLTDFIEIHPSIVLSNFNFEIVGEDDHFTLYEKSFEKQMIVAKGYNLDLLSELCTFCASYRLLFV